MAVFNVADELEQACDFVETLLAGLPRELRVHVGPLVVFTGCGRLEVFGGRRNASAVQKVKPHVGVRLLVRGGFFKNGSYILVALGPGRLSEESILVSGLRFSRKGGLQVGLGLRALEILFGSRGVLCGINLFKVGNAVPANGACEAFRQLALVEKSAYLAAVARLLFSLRLGFYVAVVKRVGYGGLFREDVAVDDVGNKHRVRAQVDGAYHVCRYVRVGMLRYAKQAVARAARVFAAGELVGVPAALEAEALENFKGRGLRKDRHVELARLLDHLGGAVGIVQCHRNPVGGTGYLNDGVGDACVVFFAAFRADDVEAVAYVVHCLIIHITITITIMLFSVKSKSSENSKINICLTIRYWNCQTKRKTHSRTCFL